MRLLALLARLDTHYLAQFANKTAREAGPIKQTPARKITEEDLDMALFSEEGKENARQKTDLVNSSD